MSNLNKILIILLALQLAVTAFAFWPKATVQAGGPLLSDITADKVTQLTMHDSDGNTLEVARSDAGWVLPGAGDFPVQPAKVTALLTKLATLNGNRPVTQTEASHNRLKVGASDYNRLVEITLSDGTQHKVYIGSSAGAGATHVRIDDQPVVYLAADLATFDADATPGSWVDTAYVQLTAADVTALTLENGNGTFEFSKEGDAWTLAGLTTDEVFNDTGFNGVLNGVANVRLVAPVGQTAQPEYGLDQPAATATLTVKDGDATKTVTLLVGAKAGDNSFYAKSSESPYIVTISDFTGNNLIDKTREDFLQQPTPEAAGDAPTQ